MRKFFIDFQKVFIFCVCLIISENNCLSEEKNTMIKIENTFESGSHDETMKDYDGNEYKTVKIGDQIWMAENLRSLHYSDGSEIKGVFAYSEDPDEIRKYGRLYNGYAISGTPGICPPGWRIPTDEDWQRLEQHLGVIPSEILKTGWRGGDYIGVKLKKNAAGFFRKKYDKAYVNQSRFSALPAGTMLPIGLFIGRKYFADFWTATETSDGKMYMRSLAWLNIHPGSCKIYRKTANKKWGFSVRLIKE